MRNLRSGENDTIKYIKDFIMAEKEPYMLYSVCHGDTIASFDVYIKNLLTSETTLVTENKTEVTNLSLDQNGKQWAFLTTDQKSDKAQNLTDYMPAIKMHRLLLIFQKNSLCLKVISSAPIKN
ncbi:MAG: hypothetical protein IPJ13_30750 [Saprospiraceae bacterium]|nr:hypothetical protein [Saprospiraceae bacterium]